MPMLTLIGVLFAANARVGWLLGYHSVSRYVIFWLPSTTSHKREPLLRMRLPFGRLAREAWSARALTAIVTNIQQLADRYSDMSFVFENHDGASSRPKIAARFSSASSVRTRA